MNDEQLDQITRVQAKYANDLMQRAHVVGVGVGMAMQGGAYTDEPALVVMVDEKVPLDALAPADVLPRSLDGVRVDVQAVGSITAL